MCVPPILLSLAVVGSSWNQPAQPDYCHYGILYTGKCPPDPLRGADGCRSGLCGSGKVLRHLQCQNYFPLCPSKCHGSHHCQYHHGDFRYDSVCSRLKFYRHGYSAAFSGVGCPVVQRAAVSRFTAPYLLVFPGVLIILSSLAFNLVRRWPYRCTGPKTEGLSCTKRAAVRRKQRNGKEIHTGNK